MAVCVMQRTLSIEPDLVIAASSCFVLSERDFQTTDHLRFEMNYNYHYCRYYNSIAAVTNTVATVVGDTR
jgi:hypothetical protein